MKKLMIAFVGIAFAAVAHAATVSWAISNVQTGDSTKLTSGSEYVFFATSSSAAESAIAAIQALAGTGADSLTTAMSSAAFHDTKKATAAGNFGIGTSAALGGYTLPTLSELGLSGETTYYAYAVIFDTETITDASNYIVTGVASATTPASSASVNKTFNIGSQAANTTWSAVGVPEPTSGLLMLIGVAGLALRRRRA